VKADLEQLSQLLQALEPQQLVWNDDSHLHVGHAGAREGGHYRLLLVSERFAGMTRVARHRLIYDALGPLGPLGVHALQIDAKAPGET
jgi:BolA protein